MIPESPRTRIPSQARGRLREKRQRKHFRILFIPVVDWWKRFLLPRLPVLTSASKRATSVRRGLAPPRSAPRTTPRKLP